MEISGVRWYHTFPSCRRGAARRAARDLVRGARLKRARVHRNSATSSGRIYSPTPAHLLVPHRQVSAVNAPIPRRYTPYSSKHSCKFALSAAQKQRCNLRAYSAATSSMEQPCGVEPYRLMFIGNTGSGKSALAASLVEKKKPSAGVYDSDDDYSMPKILDIRNTRGYDTRGTTKEPEEFPGITVGNKKLELVDLPGMGDRDVGAEDIISMVETVRRAPVY